MSTRTSMPISSCALGRIIPSLLLAMLLLAGAAIAPLPARAASIVVNDAGDTATGDCANPLATCTLRDAITYANSNAGDDTITFNIPSGGACSAANTCTIALGSILPGINEDLTIDGTGGIITIDGQNAVRIMDTAFSSLTLNVTALRFIRGNSSLYPAPSRPTTTSI